MSIFIFAIVWISCADQKKQDKKRDQLYILNSLRPDTVFWDKPHFVSADYDKIAVQRFCDVDKFCGEVTKFYRSYGTDGEMVYYHTNDLGIIYTLNTSWKSYTRLHSTNDRIEKRINEYMDHILSCSELVIEGDIPLKYYDQIGPKLKLEK
jgi:hypothetical protein